MEPDFTHFLSSETFRVQFCFTPTKTVRTIKDGEPRTATSTFIQLLSVETFRVQCCFTSIKMNRDEEPDFHRALELWDI